MVKKIHHINFIVRDLDAAIPAYEKILGMPVSRRDRLKQRGVRAARFLVGGTWIVLDQRTRPDSEPGQYLADRGEGFFLMSLQVDSLATGVSAIGSALADGPERAGADDWRVVDLRRDRTFGAQLQYGAEAPTE